MKIDPILAEASISVAELKKNPVAAIKAAAGFPLVVLDLNRPCAYLVPARAWEALMDRLDNSSSPRSFAGVKGRSRSR